jgi:hypothetical protein
MHRSVQANTHHLCNAARIIAVALVDLCSARLQISTKLRQQESGAMDSVSIMSST